MLGVLCGLKSEAACFSSALDVRVACSAARMDIAKTVVESMMALGAGSRKVGALLSFGLAGGLVETLPNGVALSSGQIVLATSVETAQGEVFVDPEFLVFLQSLFPEAVLGKVWGSEVLLDSVAAKKNAARRGALITDMESHVMAEASAWYGVPFGVLRVVADTADMALPLAAQVPLCEDGGVDLKRVLSCVMRSPSQIPDLVTLGVRTACAMGVLRQAAAAVVAAGNWPQKVARV